MAWWTEARFGMFIHWGLYAQAARHEWIKDANKYLKKGISPEGSVLDKVVVSFGLE